MGGQRVDDRGDEQAGEERTDRVPPPLRTRQSMARHGVTMCPESTGEKASESI
jgi:hypothetical protein